MRAVTFTTFGGPDVLTMTELPTPEPAPHQVRIEVRAAPVQPADVAARSGRFGPALANGRPYVPGWDVAGTVDAVGSDVRDFARGDRVVGLSDWLVTTVGTHAEFVVLDAAAVVAVPDTIPMVEASTLPANALTASQALELLQLGAGQTLAITGAGGAVGGYAAELAIRHGLDVVGIASSTDESFLTALGASFLDRADDPIGRLRDAMPDGVDGLLDTAVVGSAAMAAVRDGGTFVSVMPPASPTPTRGVRVETVGLRSDGARLTTLVDLAEHGGLTQRVAGTYPFEEAAQAHALLAAGGVRGRLVLTP